MNIIRDLEMSCHVDVLGKRGTPAEALAKSQVNVDTNVDAARLEARAT